MISVWRRGDSTSAWSCSRAPRSSSPAAAEASANPGVARLSSGTSRGATSGAGTSGDLGGRRRGRSPARSGSPEAAALAFAGCMRANGVPHFPDPKAGGRLSLSHGRRRRPLIARVQGGAGEVQKVPAPRPRLRPAAVRKDTGAFPDGRAVHASHGVPEFPDPRTTAPSNPRAALGGGGGVISDIEGVIFVFPGRIDEQSPAFTRAAAACAFPLHNH